MHYGGGGVCSCVIEDSEYRTTAVIHFMQPNGYCNAGWVGRAIGVGY